MSSAFHLQTDNFTTFFKNKIYFEITFTPVIQIIICQIWSDSLNALPLKTPPVFPIISD